MTSVCEEGLEMVNGPRQERYGDSTSTCRRIGEAWGAQLGVDSIPAATVAHMLIAMKSIRELAGSHHRDNNVDICGYAEIAERASTEQKVDEVMSIYHPTAFPEYVRDLLFHPPVAEDIEFLQSIAPDEEPETCEEAGGCLADLPPLTCKAEHGVKIPVTRPEREEFWQDIGRRDCACSPGYDCGCPRVDS